ncbi:MAG: Fic family protein [Chlamydiae bacterium]|nr:Fic family protein [Chlamydiota bacterium]
MLEKRLRSLPENVWKKIAQIDELKGQWIAGARLSPQILGRLKKSVLVTSTGASTRIEGAKLSDEEIEKLMRGISIQKFRDRDKQEVKGYYELLENVFDSWKRLSFSENRVKGFHQQLLKYVSKDELHRGEYKRGENRIQMIDEEGQSIGVLFDTTAPYLVPAQMQNLIEWTQAALVKNEHHPLLVIGNFLVEFLNIHPFQDGNGRLSRIITNLLLLKTGYEFVPYISHEKLVEDHKPDYYMSLRKSQKTLKTKNENIVPWLDFFLSMILVQTQEAIALLSKENIEKLLSPKQLAVWEYLQTVEEASPGKIAKEAQVARPTVNQALDRLLRLKKVERFGLGRATRYRRWV